MSGAAPIRLLDHDRELAEGLGPDEIAFARAAALAMLEQPERGLWTPDGRPPDAYAGILLRGLLVREVVVAGTASAELFGPGDVLLVPPPAEESFVPTDVSWLVLEPAAMAWLGDAFELAARRWPALNRALLARVAATSERAPFMQNLAQMVRVEHRVLLLLWHLAERFGRVGPTGVILPLKLTHRMIARLIGARRPSVTTAVLALERTDAIERRADGGFLLRTPPRPELLETAAPEAPWTSRAVTRVRLASAG